jgi:hypothetical protein
VTLPPAPPELAATRASLHAVAEQVVSAARYRATGRIGLRATTGGFGTPPFGDGEVVRVDGTDLVHEHGDDVARAALTTLAAAAAFVGVPVGAPPVYNAATHIAPDEPLAIDRDPAALLATWYALTDAELRRLRAAHAGLALSDIELWPEHFDLGVDLGDEAAGTRATFGASPGDDAIPLPYLYVGPWDASRRVGRFARESFGAAAQYDEVRTAVDPVAAVREFYAACAHDLFGEAG